MLPTGLPGVYDKHLERVTGPAGVCDEDLQKHPISETIFAACVPVYVNDYVPRLSSVCDDVASRFSPGSRIYFPLMPKIALGPECHRKGFGVTHRSLRRLTH